MRIDQSGCRLRELVGKCSRNADYLEATVGDSADKVGSLNLDGLHRRGNGNVQQKKCNGSLRYLRPKTSVRLSFTSGDQLLY